MDINIATQLRFTYISEKNLTIAKGDESVSLKTKESFIGEKIFNPSNKIYELLVGAFNNRTRERNYYKLYTKLLEGEITEEQFDSEIEENEDKYVVTAPEDKDKETIFTAASICKDLLDVNDTDEFSSLFSINEPSIKNYIKLLEK